eukprot:COSAG04_NODE_6261_length_1370_cov_0.870968_2_plen_195_part_00
MRPVLLLHQLCPAGLRRPERKEPAAVRLPPALTRLRSVLVLPLAQLNESERFVGRWSDWEQLDVIPPSRRARYNETLFGKLGRCRDHPAVASQLYSYPTAQDKTQIREPKPTEPKTNQPEPEPEPELTSSCFAVQRYLTSSSTLASTAGRWATPPPPAVISRSSFATSLPRRGHPSRHGFSTAAPSSRCSPLSI